MISVPDIMEANIPVSLVLPVSTSHSLSFCEAQGKTLLNTDNSAGS